jgi:hypothetical protein
VAVLELNHEQQMNPMQKDMTPVTAETEAEERQRKRKPRTKKRHLW